MRIKLLVSFCAFWTTLSAGPSVALGLDYFRDPTLIQLSPRSQHIAIKLDDGNILIAGGDQNNGGVKTAEIFVRSSETVAAVGDMVQKRFVHQASRLPYGGILITGGYNSKEGFLDTTELYDPILRRFIPTGKMGTRRDNHRATTLLNGNVLVTGGSDALNFYATAEIYDLPTGRFVPTGSMDVPRLYHTATLLRDGRVLITGGTSATSRTKVYLSSAEIYDPDTGQFSATGEMEVARSQHEATLLNDGRVLITGGTYDGRHATRTAEIYDPATGTFTPTLSMSEGRWVHSSVLLSDGTVLITGGLSFDDSTWQHKYLGGVELFVPKEGRFIKLPNMRFRRALHQSTLLADGSVLISGGHDDKMYIATAELVR